MTLFFLNYQQHHVYSTINQKNWSIINWLGGILVYLCTIQYNTIQYLPSRTEATNQLFIPELMYITKFARLCYLCYKPRVWQHNQDTNQWCDQSNGHHVAFLPCEHCAAAPCRWPRGLWVWLCCSAVDVCAGGTCPPCPEAPQFLLCSRSDTDLNSAGATPCKTRGRYKTTKVKVEKYTVWVK